MRKINRVDVVRLLLVFALVAGVGLALGNIGRFVPTHKIEQGVYCGSCHPEQVQELNATTHLGDFSRDIADAVYNSGNTIEAADAVAGACTMCHNYWDNFKWYGVRNFTVDTVEYDNPSIATLEPPTDVYGNAVSPYGLASTQSYVANVTSVNPNIRYHSGPLEVEPWKAGLDVYQWTNSTTGTTYTRLDYVWSKLSSLSPGPVGYQIINSSGGAPAGCGTAEKGLCHIAVGAVAGGMVAKSSFPGKNEFPEYPNGANKTLGGTGTFYQHEMAFTTAQYAAKPVKICGACHVFKLPPMRWGGEPWTGSFIKAASENNGTLNGPTSTDPFGFAPTYNAGTGQASVTSSAHVGSIEKEFNVAFRTPDWAHQNVPCIRCHVHAGINGETVSDNEPIERNTTSGNTAPYEYPVNNFP